MPSGSADLFTSGASLLFQILQDRENRQRQDASAPDGQPKALNYFRDNDYSTTNNYSGPTIFQSGFGANPTQPQGTSTGSTNTTIAFQPSSEDFIPFQSGFGDPISSEPETFGVATNKIEEGYYLDYNAYRKSRDEPNRLQGGTDTDIWQYLPSKYPTTSYTTAVSFTTGTGSRVVYSPEPVSNTAEGVLEGLTVNVNFIGSSAFTGSTSSTPCVVSDVYLHFLSRYTLDQDLDFGGYEDFCGGVFGQFSGEDDFGRPIGFSVKKFVTQGTTTTTTEQRPLSLTEVETVAQRWSMNSPFSFVEAQWLDPETPSPGRIAQEQTQREATDTIVFYWVVGNQPLPALQYVFLGPNFGFATQPISGNVSIRVQQNDNPVTTKLLYTPSQFELSVTVPSNREDIPAVVTKVTGTHNINSGDTLELTCTATSVVYSVNGAEITNITLNNASLFDASLPSFPWIEGEVCHGITELAIAFP